MSTTRSTQNLIAPISPAELEHHSRNCTICRSESRPMIEQAFLHWIDFDSIKQEFNVNRTSLYRHAHATGLFDLRRRNYRYVLERIMENVHTCLSLLTPDGVIRAVRVASRLDDDGRWFAPTQHIVVARQDDRPAPPPAQPAEPEAPEELEEPEAPEQPETTPVLSGTQKRTETAVTPTKQTTEVNLDRNKIRTPQTPFDAVSTNHGRDQGGAVGAPLAAPADVTTTNFGP